MSKTCKYGHTYITGETYEWRTNRRSGKRYRYCLSCPSGLEDRRAQPRLKDRACRRGHAWAEGSYKLTVRANGVEQRHCHECYALRHLASLEGHTGQALVDRADQMAREDRRASIAEAVQRLKAEGKL